MAAIIKALPFANMKTGKGVDDIIEFLIHEVMFESKAVGEIPNQERRKISCDDIV